MSIKVVGDPVIVTTVVVADEEPVAGVGDKSFVTLTLSSHVFTPYISSAYPLFNFITSVRNRPLWIAEFNSCLKFSFC